MPRKKRPAPKPRPPKAKPGPSQPLRPASPPPVSPTITPKTVAVFVAPSARTARERSIPISRNLEFVVPPTHLLVLMLVAFIFSANFLLLLVVGLAGRWELYTMGAIAIVSLLVALANFGLLIRHDIIVAKKTS